MVNRSITSHQLLYSVEGKANTTAFLLQLLPLFTVKLIFYKIPKLKIVNGIFFNLATNKWTVYKVILSQTHID